jgi:ketopantoate hydroxymethyltransferase
MMAGRQKATLGYLYDKMRKGEPITMITCYDYPMADLVEKELLGR